MTRKHTDMTWLVAVAGLAILGCAVSVRAGVVAHWSFDETGGTTAADTSGTVNLNGAAKNATASGGVDLSAAGVFGSGVSLDGAAGSYLTIPYLDGIHRNSYTIAAWVKPNDTGINALISDWSDVWAFRMWVSSQACIDHRYASGANTYSLYAGAISVGSWQHVAVTWDRPTRTATMFVNGINVGSTVSTQTGANLDIYNNYRNYHIGWKEDSTDTFNGAMDELWVFNQTLDETQINSLMTDNAFTLYGGSIGVNFQGSAPTAMGATEVAGYPNVAQAHWNNAAGASGTLLPLVNDEGKPTFAAVTWAAANSTWQIGVSDTPGNNRMMKGYLDDFSTGTPDTTVTVTSIPAAWLEYDVYIYFDGDNATYWRLAQFTVTDTDGVARSDGGEDSENNDFQKANVNYRFQHPWPGGGGNGVFAYGPNNDEGNYVRLSGFTGRGFTLTATAGASGTSAKRGPLNGFQIVATTRETPPQGGAMFTVR